MGILDAISGSGAAGRLGAVNDAALAQRNQAGNTGDITQGLDRSVDAYTNANAAANNAINYGVNQGVGAIQGGYDTAQGALQYGTDQSLAAAQGGYDSAGRLINQGQGQAIGALTGGSQLAQNTISGGGMTARGDITGGLYGAQGAINQGYGAGLGTLGGISATFNPYSAAGAAASPMIANALGLGGAAGNAAAQGAFQSGPGYQYQVNQALDAIKRNASATGGLASGNTLAALQSRGNDLANQSWQQWVQNLGGVSDRGLTATGQQAGAQTNVGNAQIGQGAANAGLITNAAQNLGNIATQTANNLGTIQYGTGQAAAGIDTNALNAQAQAAINAGNARAGIYGGYGTGAANLATAQGQNIANIYGTGAGRTAADAMTTGSQLGGAYTNAANQYVNANNNMTAQQIAAANTGANAGPQAGVTALNTLGGIGGNLLKLGGLGLPGGGTLGGAAISGIGDLSDWFQGGGGTGGGYPVGGGGQGVA